MKITTGELLAISTGRLFCELDRIYEILSYITGDNLYTHQLPRAFRVVSPKLKLRFPWLETVDENALVKERWQEWVAGYAENHGNEFDVQPLAAGEWQSADPVQEMIEMLEDKSKVIMVKV